MNDKIEITKLEKQDLFEDMLLGFRHYQVILNKWIKTNDGWELINASDLREWNDEKRKWIPKYLQQQIERGGSAIGAYSDDVLIGFCCVDGILEGTDYKYANLTMLFVDDEWKRMGVGKTLFTSICDCAKEMQADRLFISAIPSLETISFYFQMGCADAQEIIAQFVDTENDRYLEYVLSNNIKSV